MAELIIPSRRRFLLGAGALLAAPAIVRVASLMPVSVIEPEVTIWNAEWGPPLSDDWRYADRTFVTTGYPLQPGETVTLSGFDAPDHNGTWRVVSPNEIEALTRPSQAAGSGTSLPSRMGRSGLPIRPQRPPGWDRAR
jgi:hypothetical protein